MKWSSVLNILTLAIIAGLVFFFARNNSIHIVLSGSMQPAFYPGDVLLVKPFTGSVSAGQVITFLWDNKSITHRVMEVKADHVITRGDNNPAPDPWEVGYSQIVGVPYFRIPYLGYFIDFVRKPLGFLLVILIPVSLFILNEIREMFVKINKSKYVLPQ